MAHPNPLLGSVDVFLNVATRGTYFRNASVCVYGPPEPSKLVASFDSATDGFTSDTILQSAASVIKENHGGRQLQPGVSEEVVPETAAIETMENATILRIVQDLRKLDNDDFRTFAKHFLGGRFTDARKFHAFLHDIIKNGNVQARKVEAGGYRYV